MAEVVINERGMTMADVLAIARDGVTVRLSDSAIAVMAASRGHIDALVAIKSKEELVGEIITLLQSPSKNVISALQSGGGKLSGILKTLSER
mgnify:CR=1 FL=1